jgi:hypothetical protein
MTTRESFLACEWDDLLYINALKGALTLFNTGLMFSPLTIPLTAISRIVQNEFHTTISHSVIYQRYKYANYEARLFNSDFSIELYLLDWTVT